jgi:uncharacterized protein YndB with AHSA1/START domain
MPDLSRFAVMQHLGVLEEAKLVLFRKEGRTRLNYANPAPLREMYERWVNQHASNVAETAQHLRRYAESNKKMDHEYRHVKIEMELRINAPREKVFAALTTEYDNWWPHRFKPDSTCYCEGKIGGYFGESFKDGGGAITGIIVYFDPPYKMVASSPGAMSRGTGAYAVDTLEEDGDGTIYKRSMDLWGTVSPETEKMFQEGTRALMEQALVAYVEQGRRYAP